MAYSDFTQVSQLEDKFGIQQKLTRIFEVVMPLEPSITDIFEIGG